MSEENKKKKPILIDLCDSEDEEDSSDIVEVSLTDFKKKRKYASQKKENDKEPPRKKVKKSLSKTPSVQSFFKKKNDEFIRPKPKNKKKYGIKLGHKTKKIKTFRKASSGGKSNFPKIPQFKTILKSKKKKNVIEVSQWVDKHSPQTKEQLHVHQSKVKEIEQWLSMACDKTRKNFPRILLLCGPSGCGKTTVVNILSKEKNLTLTAFGDEVDMSSSRLFRSQKVNHLLDYQSKMGKFESFVCRTSRYTSLVGGKKENQLTLVEHIPYIGKPEYHKKFIDIMNRIIQKRKDPIIFTITSEKESDGSREIRRIFVDLLDLPCAFAIIKMNPVATTLMKKALNVILKSENCSHLVSQIPGIIKESCGDLRNAIFSLQFQAIGNSLNKPKKKKKRKKNSKKDKSLIGGRDANFSLFHALGKVLYAKRTETVEEILNHTTIDYGMFANLLVDNSFDFLNEDFDKMCNAIEHYADADLFNIATRKNKWNGIHKMNEQLTSIVASHGYLLQFPERPKFKSKGLRKVKGSLGRKCDILAAELTNVINPAITQGKIKQISPSTRWKTVYSEDLPFLCAAAPSNISPPLMRMISTVNTYRKDNFAYEFPKSRDSMIRWVPSNKSIQNLAENVSSLILADDDIEDFDDEDF